MKGFSADELAIIQTIRDITGEQIDECECLEAWEEMLIVI